MNRDDKHSMDEKRTLESLTALREIAPSQSLQQRALKAMREATTRPARPTRRRPWWTRSVAIPMPVAILTCGLLGGLGIYTARNTSHDAAPVRINQAKNHSPKPDPPPPPPPHRTHVSQQVAFYLPSAGYISNQTMHYRED